MSNSIPTGTIVAYSGTFGSDDVVLLKKQGWLPCDGTSYAKKDYIDLALSVGTNYGGTGGGSGSFNVPDFRGRFVRGVALGTQNDPDALTRTASNPGGNIGDEVGSLQQYATGQPHTPFVTSTDGLHTHNVPHAPVTGNAYAIAGGHYGLWNDGAVNVNADGNHNHTVVGGYDVESRPVNCYVNFIIKYSA